MEKVLFVALGGGIGAGLRYLLTELANLHGGAFFPYGTVLANIIGSFCIGVFFVFFCFIYSWYVCRICYFSFFIFDYFFRNFFK